MDQELYRFRSIIGHEGPLKATDPNWKGSKWNVQIEWESGEITYEPLMTEFRQPLQVQIHLEMPRILVQLGPIQRT